MARKQVKYNRQVKNLTKWFDKSTLEEQTTDDRLDLIERICDHIVETGDSLPKVCRGGLVGKDTPKLTTLYYWMKKDPRIGAAIHGARQAAADARWSELGQQIEEEFDAAITLGDKATMMATEKKMALLYKYRQFEVEKLLPALYGSDDARAAVTGGKRDIEKLKQEGVVVVERVLEIPAKVKKEPIVETVQEERAAEPITIDIAAKRRR